MKDAGLALLTLALEPEGNGRDRETVEWVEAARAWVPPADLATRQVQVEWAVKDWIQAGKVGALVAGGGTGKTTLLIVLGVCISLGWAFFGHTVKRGSFVILSNDDTQDDLDGVLALIVQALQLSAEDADTVARKLRLISLIGKGGSKTFTVTIGGTVTPTDLPALLSRAVEGMDDLVGVALDTLRQFSGGSSNDEQVIKLTIAGATEFAASRRVFVVLPHHTGKQNYRDGVTDMYCGSGSAAIADNCRFVLLLQTTTWADIESKVQRTGQERGDPLVLRSTRGSMLVKEPPPIFLHRDGYFVGLVKGKTLTDNEQAEKKDRGILQAVRGGAQSKTAILEKTGGKKQTVFARIGELEDLGYLSNGSQNGSPKYVLTTNGANFLDHHP